MFILITGSERGLGLELVREGVRLGCEIITICLSVSKQLAELGKANPSLIKIYYINGFINNAGVNLEKLFDNVEKRLIQIYWGLNIL